LTLGSEAGVKVTVIDVASVRAIETMPGACVKIPDILSACAGTAVIVANAIEVAAMKRSAPKKGRRILRMRAMSWASYAT